MISMRLVLLIGRRSMCMISVFWILILSCGVRLVVRVLVLMVRRIRRLSR